MAGAARFIASPEAPQRQPLQDAGLFGSPCFSSQEALETSASSESPWPCHQHSSAQRCRGAAEYHVTVEMTDLPVADRHGDLCASCLFGPSAKRAPRTSPPRGPRSAVPAASRSRSWRSDRSRPDRALPVPRSPGRAVAVASVRRHLEPDGVTLGAGTAVGLVGLVGSEGWWAWVSAAGW